ncbi:hypothetical protein PbJCM13498_26790 [Prolixibacter bellariivorans]|uniref:Uncharacterized protein n=1 Tax=Prolixibacter bellariivorans TaxID=314319 RepID=A0A5M4B1P8_9BACT|nr:DsrE family protein [Prolixibacter bellariivorans]GET33816.1 hypothetical protein PbJCM13498_26790 [Prolixibacter bellariivorans]
MKDHNDHLAVIWASGDPDVAEKVCLMYTHNAHLQHWFQEVRLVVWGPSAKLLTENDSLQNQIRDMLNNGLTVEACATCASMYGITDQLHQLGIDVRPMGVPLTSYLKDGWKVLTF